MSPRDCQGSWGPVPLAYKSFGSVCVQHTSPNIHEATQNLVDLNASARQRTCRVYFDFRVFRLFCDAALSSFSRLYTPAFRFFTNPSLLPSTWTIPHGAECFCWELSLLFHQGHSCEVLAWNMCVLVCDSGLMAGKAVSAKFTDRHTLIKCFCLGRCHATIHVKSVSLFLSFPSCISLYS